MTFLNLLLLGGIAAFAVPLIIHLLNRSKFQVIDWGAMQFLDATVQQNSRRLQWQQWLLLLIRCAIPILLAICMARPLLTFWTTSSSDGQAAVALVLDDSYSMQALESSGKESAWEKSASETNTILQGMGRGTHWIELTPGGEVRNRTEGSTVDSMRVKSLIEKQEPTEGPSQFLPALREGLLQLDGIPQSRKHLLIASDFRKRDWQGIDDAALQEISRTAAKPIPVSISLLPIRTQATDNISLRFDAEYSELVGVGETLEARLLIKNHGAKPMKGMQVVILIDEVELASKVIDLGASEELQMMIPASFTKAGMHSIQATINDPAPIQADNTATLGVQCIDKFRVLIVDPVPVANAMEAESAFLEMALEATETASSSAPWIQIQRIHADGLIESMVKDVDVIIIAGATRVPDAATPWIATRVTEGAGLVWFPGEKTDSAWFNQHWSGLLPMKIGTRKNLADFAGQTIQVAHENFQDPLLGFFAAGVHGKLDRIDLQSWFQLEAKEQPAQSDTPKNAVSILGKLTNGDPWLIESTLGKGKVYQLSTSCNDQWNNAPLRPIFVPLMQRLIIGARYAVKPLPEAQRTQESELEPLSEQEITSLASKLNAQIIDSGNEFLQNDKLRSTGRELWRWILLALVIFLFVELFMQRPLTRGTL